MKSDFIYLHGKTFLLLLLTSILLLSCTSSDKKEIISKTEAVIVALSSADYSSIPGLEQGMNNIDDDSSKLIQQNMSKAGDWTIKIDHIEGFSAMTLASTKINGSDYSLIFNFTYDGKSWQLDDNVSLQSKVEFIPFIGLE